MSIHRFARVIRPALARLGAAALALVILLPGGAAPLRAAPPSTAAPTRARPAPPRRAQSSPALNHNPVVVDDNLVAFAGQEAQTLFPLDNDTDIDLDPLTIISTTHSPNADLFRPTDFLEIEYTPNPGFVGVDVIGYGVSDGQGGSATGTITVTVVAPGAAGTTSSSFAVNSCLPSPSGCDTSYWHVSPNSGASADTASGTCNGTSGLGIQDAYSWVSELRGAFDTGLTVWVDGQQLTPRLPMTVTHYSLVSGPVTMSNLRVTVHYDGLLSSDTLRTQVVLGNATGSPHSSTVTVASNLGSNAATIVAGSSTGDANFTTADRWLVTSNSATFPSRLVDTHVLYGPGSPLVTPSAVYTTTFKCGGNPLNSRGVRADFNVTVPAHSNQRLLFFNQIHSDNAPALADAAVFNSEPYDLLAGLTNDELSRVVNWNLLPISRLDLPVLMR